MIGFSRATVNCRRVEVDKSSEIHYPYWKSDYNSVRDNIGVIETTIDRQISQRDTLGKPLID